MLFRCQDERKIKIELMIKSLLDFIDEKLIQMNKGG